MPEDYNYRPRASSASAGDGNVYTAEQAAALIARYQAVRQPHAFDGRCPYVGAAPFQESDARIYFGHENQLEALLDRVERGDGFICISGPESSGKTSLIQAGLVFALRNGAILDSDTWLIHTFTPGNNPLQSLADACATLGQRAGLADMVTDAIRKRGLTGPNALHNFIDMLLGPNPKRRGVLIVDQFEEIFTKTKEEGDRRTFINFITQIINEPPARLILIVAIRSEFFPQLANYVDLNKLIAKPLVEVQPMEPKELARAIVLPALETGVTIEPQLVARLVNDVYGDPAMLPKLQMVLRDLFIALPAKRGAEKPLLLADYIDFGPLREREGDRPPAVTASDGTATPQPLRATLGEKGAVSHFARQEARLRQMKIVTAVVTALGLLALAFGAFGLLQREQFNQQAIAAATAEAVAQAEATRAMQSASAADQARAAAEAQATRSEQERQIALATRAVAEAEATRAAEARAAALSNEATAVALATSVVNREQNAVAMEATISAVATQSGAQVRDALAAKATADVGLKATRSRELAAVALTQLATDPQLALLIALEAERTGHTPQSEDAVRRAFVAAFPDDGAFRHPAAVTDARVSSDGTRLLTASRDGLARLWDIAGGAVITTYRGHVGQVTSASFSPDGKQILTTSTDRTARVWNLDTGRVITVLTGHTGVVNDGAYAPNGALAVTGGADRTARVWDLATGQAIGAPIQAAGVISAVAFLDENQIGVRTANGAQRFDARTGADLGVWEIGGFPVVTRLPDGTLSLQPDGSGGPINLYGHTRPATLTDDVGGMIVTVSNDGTARVHRFRLDEVVGRVQELLQRQLTCEERVRYLSESLDCTQPLPTATAAK